MTGAAHIGFPSLFDGMIGANLVRLDVVAAVGGLDKFQELVIQAFGSEIAFLFRNPFVQAKMRLDDELAHGSFFRDVRSGVPSHSAYFRASRQLPHSPISAG